MNELQDISTGDIIDAISPLIDDGRITGTVRVDGILILNSGNQNVTDLNIVTYDEYGFSDHDQYGCVRIRAIDEYVADWLANGDVFQVEAAEKSSQHYGILVPDREYTDEQRKNVYANNQGLWLMNVGLRLGQFAMYGDRYYNTRTDETASKLTPEQRYSRQWRRNPNYRGETVANHRSVGWGNAVDPRSPLWKEYMTEKLPAEVIRRMEQAVDVARRRAEDGPNVVRPKFVKGQP